MGWINPHLCSINWQPDPEISSRAQFWLSVLPLNLYLISNTNSEDDRLNNEPPTVTRSITKVDWDNTRMITTSFKVTFLQSPKGLNELCINPILTLLLLTRCASKVPVTFRWNPPLHRPLDTTNLVLVTGFLLFSHSCTSNRLLTLTLEINVFEFDGPHCLTSHRRHFARSLERRQEAPVCGSSVLALSWYMAVPRRYYELISGRHTAFNMFKFVHDWHGVSDRLTLAFRMMNCFGRECCTLRIYCSFFD